MILMKQIEKELGVKTVLKGYKQTHTSYRLVEQI